jgi:hypothetical protein
LKFDDKIEAESWLFAKNEYTKLKVERSAVFCITKFYPFEKSLLTWMMGLYLSGNVPKRS